MSKFRTKYFPEGILIIVSILIAFAIDAWWDERQQRAKETQILQALRAEFQENADKLPRYIEIRKTNAEHARILVEDIQASSESTIVLVTPAQLESFTLHGSFDPVRGAFDAMLQSGGLRLIENKELRQRLVQWPSLVADAVENDHFLRTVAAPRMFDYLSKRVDLGLVGQMTCRSESPLEDCPTTKFELEATRELSSLVSHVGGWSAEGAVELAVVKREAISLVRALDNELAKK